MRPLKKVSLLLEWGFSSTIAFSGSKDNISAVIVQLPGAVLGPHDNVVEKKRENKLMAAGEQRNGDGSKDDEEG